MMVSVRTWFSSLPEGWTTVPLGQLGQFKTSSVDKKSNGDEVPVGIINYLDVYRSRDGKITSSLSPQRVTARPSQLLSSDLRRGDILFTPSSETRDDIGHCAVVIEDLKDTLFSYHLVRFRPRSGIPLDLRYRFYLCENPIVGAQFSIRASGTTRMVISLADFREVTVALPPLGTQKKLADFLDRETERIDGLIEKKERLIALLEEKWAALITGAVTKGLDPTVPMKDSGVEWIGEIPEHWEVSTVKRVAQIDNSGSYGEDPDKADFAAPVATTAQIDSRGHFKVAQMPTRGFNEQDLKRYGCRPGDILVVKSSGSVSNVISGKAGVVLQDTPFFVFSNFLLRVKPNPKQAHPHYLFLLLNSHLTKERVNRMVAGTTYPNLRVSEYVSSGIPLPPLSEQGAIYTALKADLARIDRVREMSSKSITLLRERRSALITAAVTGQIDVRSWRPPDDWTAPEVPTA